MTSSFTRPAEGRVSPGSVHTRDNLPVRSGRRSRTGNRAQTRAAWLFLLPFIALFLVFTALPILAALGMSFTDITVREIRTPFAVDFVGLDNFVRVATDPKFLRAALNTALFVVLCVPLSMGVGLGLALILDRGIRRLRAFFRAAVYLPVITNIVAAAVVWQYAFAPSGPANAALESVGVTGPNWFGEPGWAVASVVMLGVWRNIGTCMVLFLAGLQAVPADVYEAAAIDGASRVRTFRSITMPLLRPTTLLVTVLMTVAFLNIFEEPYLLTNGGPLGSTRSMAMWVYEQFGFGNTALSMTGSLLLLLVVSAVAIVQFRMLRPKQ